MNMKDYISNLTDDELEWLCSEIPIYKYEEYFKAPPMDSLIINKSENQGKHRLEKLVYITLKNKNLDFVKKFLNQNARSIVLAFSRQLSIYEQHYKNLNFDEAMARTLKLFHFGGRVVLYFKLTEKRIDSEYIRKLNQLIRKLDMEKEKYPRFGVIPLSDEVEENNRESVHVVKSFIENNEIVTKIPLIDAISCVKGMFNRILRHDQDDWYIINAYFDYPIYEDMHMITSSLPLLRKAIINTNQLSMQQALNNLKKYNFINYCNNYLIFYSDKISNVSTENETLFSIISADNDLMIKCKEMLKEDWQKENDSMLREVDEQIKMRRRKKDEINTEIEHLRATISELTKQEKGLQKIDEINSEIEKLRATVSELTKLKNQLKKEIDDQEFMADYIQRSVAEKIEDARKNAADFVKEMSFQYGMNESMNMPYNYIEGKESFCFTEPGCDDWKDLMNHLSEQLIKAGVCKKYSDSFAAFMFSAYLNQFPLLLAGPNAMEIADAFSVTMNGNTAGTLYCKADISYHDIDRILKNDDEIIKIVEPFSCRIIPALFERAYSNKYFIAIHPIAEDIVIEPKGYTNYFYPVLTDMFVDSLPSRTFNQIETNDGYEAYRLTKADKKYVKLLRELYMSMMTYNRINDVIFNLHKMLDDDSVDFDVLYAILPYAYMTMQTDKLLDAVNQEKIKISKDLSDELNRMFGDE